jgi:hypothetical protein
MVEQLMISPLSYGEECQALFGIQNIDISMVFREPLSRMLSGDIYSLFDYVYVANNGAGTPTPFRLPMPVGVKANPSFSIDVQRALLHLTYLQPQANQVVPFRLNYPYYSVRRFQTDDPALLTGEPDVSYNSQNVQRFGEDPQGFRNTINFNNVTLHEIPKRMYLFAKGRPSTVADAGRLRSDVAQTTQASRPADNIVAVAPNTVDDPLDAIHQTDTFAHIRGLRVNFDSQDGRLSTLTSYDLWKLSCRNGLKRSWQFWRYYGGSVLCLEFGKDLNLNPLLCPSVRGNFQLSLSLDIEDNRDVRRLTGNSLNGDGVLGGSSENPAGRAPQRYRGYMVLVPVGVVTIENQLITTSIGAITEEQVLSAPWADPGLRITYSGIYGGSSFLKNVWSGIKKGVKFAKPVIGPLAGIAGDVLSTMGDPRAQVAGKVLSATSRAMSGRGGSRTGGAKVRCSSLSRRI